MKNLSELPLFSLASAESSATSVPAAPKHWSVSELTTRIRGVLEPAFVSVWVQGEVSNYRPSPSGHAYFSLKDAQSSISAAIFGWGAKRKASFDLKDGMEVLCKGKVSIYPPRGTYQFVIDQIEPLGAGALQLAFEQLKQRLAQEGLFDAKRKRPLPRFPRRLAVVTSPSGAAIRDMLNILARRAPHIEVVIIPALVQGEEAPAQVMRGLQLANEYNLGDIVILARGGGSIEDLWGFNHEGLARAIAQSRLPVVNAVGHEIDFTIADFVADLRAPTPSAAAELVTGSWVESIRILQEAQVRLKSSLLRNLQNRKILLGHIAARVVNPRDRLREQAQRTDELFLRMDRAIKVRLERRRSLIEQMAGRLDALSPLRVLERGYTLVRESTAEGAPVVRSVKQLVPGQGLVIKFYDGDAKVKVQA